ncbi:MAG: hypothetical protein OXC13_05765 [Caldilineaceae bacterium]|nr:hypothetical protein [Caldilineaceae bacterium]
MTAPAGQVQLPAFRSMWMEVLLGETRAAGRFWHLGNPGPFGLGELPAGVAVPIGCIRHGLGHLAIGGTLTLGLPY